MITMQRLLALLVVATSLNLQGMGYLKSLFVTPECFDSKENKDLLEELKKSADQGKISSGRLLVIQYKTQGGASCVLSELGKVKQQELYTQLEGILGEAKNSSFYSIGNLTAVNKAYHDAKDILAIIHLGSSAEGGTDRYKQAKKAVDILRDNLENLEDQARTSKQPQAQQPAKS